MPIYVTIMIFLRGHFVIISIFWKFPGKKCGRTLFSFFLLLILFSSSLQRRPLRHWILSVINFLLTKNSQILFSKSPNVAKVATTTRNFNNLHMRFFVLKSDFLVFVTGIIMILDMTNQMIDCSQDLQKWQKCQICHNQSHFFWVQLKFELKIMNFKPHLFQGT